MATTIYISINDVAYVRTSGENYSVGIGWTSVAELCSVAEVLDILVGDTRAVFAYDAIDATDVPTISHVLCAKLDEKIPVRWGEIEGNRIAQVDDFAYIPVREVMASGGIIFSYYIPTRECSAQVSHTWGADLSARMPVRSIEAATGAEQVACLIPTRGIDAEVYDGGVSVNNYIPVREITATEVGIVFATFAGKIPPRSLSVTGYADISALLSKFIPPRKISANVLQDYSATLSKLIPPRIIEAAEYETQVSVEGYIPVRLSDRSVDGGGSTGGGGEVSSTVSEDYILRYTRP